MSDSIERTKKAIQLESSIRSKSVPVGPAMKELYDLVLTEKAEGSNGSCEALRFNRLYKNIAYDAAKSGNAAKFLACAEKYGFSEIKE